VALVLRFDRTKFLNNAIKSSERYTTLNKIEECLLRSAVFPEILNKTKESERHIYQNIRNEWRAPCPKITRNLG
jgi:hypothetical protein